jgi:hypothetical protein
MMTKEEMYDRLFPAIYLKMVERFLPDLKLPDEEGMLFTESDQGHLANMADQARAIADIGADIHSQGPVKDEGEASQN